MRSILHNTIIKFRNHLEMLLEDIKLEKDGYQLAFYFDSGHLQRAVLGYKDYYNSDRTIQLDKSDRTFRLDKFNDDTTLVCSLVSGGFIGPFRLLRPHQDEFLTKIRSQFGGVSYEHWRAEVRAFVNDTELDLNADEFLSQLQYQTDEELIKRFTEYTETTKRGFNVSHCLLPWERRWAGWDRKKLLFLDENKPNYNSIFSSREFATLKKALDAERTHKINNFIDATALSILLSLTRDFRDKGAKLAPRFFLPRSEYNTFRIVLEKTNLISEFDYRFDKRTSSVLRDEEYFFYRSFFIRKHRNENSDDSSKEEEKQVEQYYEKVSKIETSDSLGQIDFDDNSLQEIIEGMESHSFLKNVWIEFINSGDLKVILGDLENIKRQFDEARRSYRDESFKVALKRISKNIFDNLDEVKWASILWEEIDKAVIELRKKISNSNWDADALFRNRKLFRYGFPKACHAEIKKYLSLLLSNEMDVESTQKAMSKVVNLYSKARSWEENVNQEQLILLTAILCALELKGKLKALLEKLRRKFNLHFSLEIALAGAELDFNNYERGKNTIEDLEKLYYNELTKTSDRCDLAIGLTYLYYYAWLARKRAVDRQSIHSTEEPKVNQEINRLINNAIVFAERATSLVSTKDLAQRVYVYNQYLFCLVESGNPENNKKMRDIFPKLNDYMNQADVWSYMYYDTLSRYFYWRAKGQTDKNQREVFMKHAISLCDDAMASAPNDEEIKKFRSELINGTDLVEVGAEPFADGVI